MHERHRRFVISKNEAWKLPGIGGAGQRHFGGGYWQWRPHGSLAPADEELCRFTAKNATVYERFVAKGKNGKLALIAVGNKLLKQAFAIVTSGMPYQAHFAKSPA